MAQDYSPCQGKYTEGCDKPGRWALHGLMGWLGRRCDTHAQQKLDEGWLMAEWLDVEQGILGNALRPGERIVPLLDDGDKGQ